MSRNFVVYQSRNRLTGTLMQTLDTKHADAPKQIVAQMKPGMRYLAFCVEHATVIQFAEHYPAGRAIAHPDEWCKKCQAMIGKGTRAIADALTTSGLDALLGTDLHYASDKRWRDGKQVQAKKSVTSRNAEQASMYIAAGSRTQRESIKAQNLATEAMVKRTQRASRTTRKQATVEAIAESQAVTV